MKSTKHLLREEMVQDKREKNVLAQIQQHPRGTVEFTVKNVIIYTP